MDPRARVSYALLPAKGFEQVHHPGTLRVGPGRHRLPLDAWRVCGLRGERNVEQVLVILALLQVGTRYLPSSDVIVPALDVVEGSFRRFPRVGRSEEHTSELQSLRH